MRRRVGRAAACPRSGGSTGERIRPATARCPADGLPDRGLEAIVEDDGADGQADDPAAGDEAGEAVQDGERLEHDAQRPGPGRETPGADAEDQAGDLILWPRKASPNWTVWVAVAPACWAACCPPGERAAPPKPSAPMPPRMPRIASIVTPVGRVGMPESRRWRSAS
jgi:hypothetical protein